MADLNDLLSNDVNAREIYLAASDPFHKSNSWARDEVKRLRRDGQIYEFIERYEREIDQGDR